MTYTLIKSKRKTIAIEIKPDGSVIVRAPMRATKRHIEAFLLEKASWIERTRKKALENKRNAVVIPKEKLEELANQAKNIIPTKVKYWAEIIGVSYGRITIRNQKTRWGSCSSTGNLNFNCLLMLCPENVLDYVIVHELCHRKELNHSSKFWECVESAMPDYKTHRTWLKENGSRLLIRKNI